MPITRSIDYSRQAATLGHDLEAGLLSGQVAGLVMAGVIMAVFAVVLGESPLFPFQVIGMFVFGEDALRDQRWPAFFAGLGFHQLGPSLFWGGAFGLAAHGFAARTGARLLALGLATGLLSQLVDVNLVLPTLFPAMRGRDLWAEEIPAVWSWAAHIAFGLGLCVFPLFLRKLEDEPRVLPRAGGAPAPGV